MVGLEMACGLLRPTKGELSGVAKRAKGIKQ